jgi:manganese/iron transport system substrate-binding protein
MKSSACPLVFSTNPWTKPLSILGVILVLCLTGCGVSSIQERNPANDKPKVVSTSNIIANLTEAIGAEEIDHQGILKPGTDPHVYEPVPTDSVALEKADLILYNGYNLEPGLIKLMNAAGIKAKKIPVGEVVAPLNLDKEGKKQPDPHVWGNAQNGIKMVKAIRDQLVTLSPENKQKFNENAARLTKELQQLDNEIKQEIAKIPPKQRQLVTTHDAFQYYARAYGLKVTGTLIGISTEEQPSAQTVKKLADEIKKTGIKTIFAETTINPLLIQAVAEEAGVKLADKKLYSDSIGVPGSEADSYGKMLKTNTKIIVDNLSR